MGTNTLTCVLMSCVMTQGMLEVAKKDRIAFEEQMEQEERIQVCTLILYLFVVVDC